MEGSGMRIAATLDVLSDCGDRYAREMRAYARDGWTWTARDLLANSLDGRTPNLDDAPEATVVGGLDA